MSLLIDWLRRLWAGFCSPDPCELGQHRVVLAYEPNLRRFVYRCVLCGAVGELPGEGGGR